MNPIQVITPGGCPKALRLWLDDIRKPPWGYDLWARTAAQCIEMLQAGDVVHVSLDHDLADEHYSNQAADRSTFTEKTGFAVLEWMQAANRWVPDISVHTLNPKSGEDMMTELRNHAPAGVQFRRVKPHMV
jgi:hypothetical protein